MAPPKKWIDKKSAQNFQIRYRSQNDPLIHDSNAADFVFAPVEAPNASKSKGKTKHDLENEIDVSSIRPNEGEAANYGIYFDDSKYDYMQHLRDIGEGGNDVQAVFIEAKQPKGKGKKKMTLEEALRAEDEENKKKEELLLPKELLPSETLVKRTWEDQMDIPTRLQGFQPDMDPRLREVLEALEDDAYVEDDENLFGELANGEVVDEEDFEDTYFDEEDEDGYASDATEKAPQQASQMKVAEGGKEEVQLENKDKEGIQLEGGDDWMKEYKKFAKERKKSKKMDDDMSSMADTMSFGGLSSIGSTMSVSKRRRRREKKGTATSGYSMSSSSLFRTEGLTLLDDRFEKIEEMYNEDSDEEEGEDHPNGYVPETRQDFDRILDEFLGQYNVVGSTPARARVKRGKQMTGMEQLDEIRKGLGKARIS